MFHLFRISLTYYNMLKRKLLVEVKIFIIWTKKNKEAENPLWFVEVSNGETVTLVLTESSVVLLE